MSCPSGHVLKDNMCTIAPTMTCPSGYTLMNGMCQPGANGESEIMGYGGGSMNIPPSQNGIVSQTLMSDNITTVMAPPPTTTPMSPMMRPMSPTMRPMSPTMSPTPPPPRTMSPMPVSPISMNNCPSGYSMNRTDNMCYPL